MSNYNSPRQWHFPPHGSSGSEEWNHAPRPCSDGGSWPRPRFNSGPPPHPNPCVRPQLPRHAHCPRPNVGPTPYLQPRGRLPPPPQPGWPQPRQSFPHPQCRPRPGDPRNGPPIRPPFSPAPPQQSHPRPMYTPLMARPTFPPPQRPESNTNQYYSDYKTAPPIAGNYHHPPNPSGNYCEENMNDMGRPSLGNIKMERADNYNSMPPNPAANDYQSVNTSANYYEGNSNTAGNVVPCLRNVKSERVDDYAAMLPNPPPNDYHYPVNTTEGYFGGNIMSGEASQYHLNIKQESVGDYNPAVPTSYQYRANEPSAENNYNRNLDVREVLPSPCNVKVEHSCDYRSEMSNEYQFPVNSSGNNARDSSSLHHSIKQESRPNSYYENLPLPPLGLITPDYQYPGSTGTPSPRFKYESDNGYNNPTPYSSVNDQQLPAISSENYNRDARTDEAVSWEHKRPLPKERSTVERSPPDRDFPRPSSCSGDDSYRTERSRSNDRSSEFDPPSRDRRSSSRSNDRSSEFDPQSRDRRSSSRCSSRNSSASDSGRRSCERSGRNTPHRDSDRRKRSRSRESNSSRRSCSVSSSRSDQKKRRSETPKRKSPDRRSVSSSRSTGRRPSRERSASRASVVPTTEVSDQLPTSSERENLLQKYRKNYCANSTDVMQTKLQELAKMTPDEVIEQEKKVWTRTAPADLFYARDPTNQNVTFARQKLLDLCKTFKTELVDRAENVRTSRPKYEPPPRKDRSKMAKHKSEACSSEEGSSGDSSTDEEDCTMEEMERKRLHPHRLHQELWFNDAGEMNDGPLCRCSARARRCGIRHGIYAGERHLLKCNVDSNNADRLHHYRITISPPTNFLTKTPTIVNHDEHEFIFEGFSMFSHFPLEKLPTCKVIRFNIEYTILYIEEKIPENFTIRELDLFHDYLFKEILELVDLDFKAFGDATGCSQFHFMPRFVRDLPDNGKEILSMNEVLHYLLDSNRELIQEPQLKDLLEMPQYKWQNFADEIKGMVVTYPGVKPCALRVDQLDRNQQGKRKPDPTDWPEIVHFGIRPPQLSYAGNPDYQKAWREYVKYRHLIANMPKPSFEDKRKLEAKENKLQEMRTLSKMKRDVTVAVASKGFFCTGIMCDMVQHAMLIPVLVCHLRFHRSCNVLEADIGYKFDNRYLLQLALTHPSYRENFGTNPDHARNSLTNCGIRQPEYGDRRIHYMNTRKRGINTLINIMSRFGKKTETESNITHNERLEFLGDAVVEFLTSIHLFHMFPDLEEGGLATYRAAIVQNQHLAVLAKRLKLEEFMLYAHGSDLCHDLELRHAMANCFEALMGALFLDGGIEVADKVFGETLFKEKTDLLDVWVNYPPHPLQEQEPLGDRKWIPHFELLQKLTEFEKSTNIQFTHIRLLARAFTDRSIGYTNLTLGSNQRLEFLGDTVLQLIASEYLYKFFPEHHEGHLSLLRSSLVNNRTQAVVCDDLAMTTYALYANPKGELKTKDRADLLEAFLGALYVDQDLEFCHVFCHVCFFPRLQDFIMNQDWNDPKSKLQQCCLTLRTMDGGEPDIPIYKVIECKGPTNTRVYTVAVYFQSRRLASASGHSIQQAEMNAAKKALDLSQELFPQLDHQKRVIAKSMKKQKWPNRIILRGRPTKPSTDRERRQNLDEC